MVILTVVPLLAASPKCESDRTADLIVVNRTSRDVNLTAEARDKRPWRYSRAEPGTSETVSFPLSGQRIIGDEICTTYSFVARDDDGKVVDRLEGPVCPGQTWEIDRAQP